MPSLTPQTRSNEVTSAAMEEGLVNGAFVLLPSLAGLYAAMQNPKFVKLTNWQSRTAITIMPALFVFALTSEHKLSHRMNEVAEETEHAIKSVEWAERQKRQSAMSSSQENQDLRAMYRRAVLNGGVQLVETPQLQLHHRMANYIQSNPFKCIAAIGIPSVIYIFYGRNSKEHLSFQLKILHTRVFGQFAVICSLLGVMGLKEVMDRRGRYITETEVEERVFEMEATRLALMERLDYQARQQLNAIRKRIVKKKDA